MFDFLEFLRKYYYLLVFLVLEAVSLLLLFRFNHYQGSVWLTAANGAAVGINRVYDDALAYGNLKTVNQQLTAENLRLQLESEALRKELGQLQRDTIRIDSLTRAKMPEFHTQPATVVSHTSTGENNFLVIDQGERDGVRPEMGVVGGNGVVGIVYMTGPNYSLVLPINNRKSSISCRVRGQRYFGYLQWDGHDARRAYVDDIPRYAKIKAGEIVETSGYSAVFPPGMVVGKVRKVRNSVDGQSYRLDIDLSIDLSTVRDVHIITTAYKPEIDTLRTQAEQALRNFESD